MKFFRRIVGKTRRDCERNTSIREELGVKAITNRLECKQLKWYGHVKRMSKERIPRKCMEARTGEKRGRGRPRKTWMRRIEELGQKRGKAMVDMNKATLNRKEWRSLAETDPTP